MESTRRLSSLSEEREEEVMKENEATTMSPDTATPDRKHEHRHHRITSFDPSIISSLSTHQIQERNEVAMSLLSSLTTTNTAHPQRRTAITVQTAQPEDVESERTGTAVRPEHIVKIFTGDHDVIEVTPEQVKRIKKMHASIENSIRFTFNYNVLLLVASVLAGLGLVTNQSTTIIASMLVSPIMGPVIGLAYGTTVWDWKLVRKSLRNEVVSLFFCIIMGMVIAACTGWTNLSNDWPTEEMESRGSFQNFLVSLPVAFFSGLGVAVSILDEQTSSLVGVAISASLLPPAVDAGILWIAYAFTKHGVIPPVSTLPAEVDEEDLVAGAQRSNALPWTPDHPDYTKADYRQMGAIALSVTLANIILIWISSMMMFRVKEVLPIEKKVFWDDLKVTRRIYQRRALLQVVEVDAGDAEKSGDMIESDIETKGEKAAEER